MTLNGQIWKRQVTNREREGYDKPKAKCQSRTILWTKNKEKKYLKKNPEAQGLRGP